MIVLVGTKLVFCTIELYGAIGWREQELLLVVREQVFDATTLTGGMPGIEGEEEGEAKEKSSCTCKRAVFPHWAQSQNEGEIEEAAETKGKKLQVAASLAVRL